MPSPFSLSTPGDTRKKVLNVGCGRADNLDARFRGEEWIEVRLDIDPEVQPDVVASITDMSMIDDGAVDAIWSCHNLEHLFPHEVPVALREFHRVLKTGGFAFVLAPDLQAAAQRVVDDRLEDPVYEAENGTPVSPRDMIYSHEKFLATENPYMLHKTGFTRRTLARRLEEAGFNGGQVWRSGWSVCARAEKRPG